MEFLVLIGTLVILGIVLVIFIVKERKVYKEKYGKDHFKMFWKDAWTGLRDFFKNFSLKKLNPFYTKDEMK